MDRAQRTATAGYSSVRARRSTGRAGDLDIFSPLVVTRVVDPQARSQRPAPPVLVVQLVHRRECVKSPVATRHGGALGCLPARSPASPRGLSHEAVAGSDVLAFRRRSRRVACRPQQPQSGSSSVVRSGVSEP